MILADSHNTGSCLRSELARDDLGVSVINRYRSSLVDDWDLLTGKGVKQQHASAIGKRERPNEFSADVHAETGTVRQIDVIGFGGKPATSTFHFILRRADRYNAVERRADEIDVPRDVESARRGA